MIVKKIVKGLGWLVVGIVAFAAALTAYFYIGGIEWGDWPIPDETELLHRKCDLMDKDNAYVALMALTNIYHVADSHEYQGVSDEEFVDYYGSPFAARDVEEYALCAAVRNDPDSPKRAEKILSANSDFFESFHVALKIDGFCAMARATTNEYAFSFSSLPSYKPIILFAKLVMLRAQVALERDDVDAAMAVRILRRLRCLCRTTSPPFQETRGANLVNRSSMTSRLASHGASARKASTTTGKLQKNTRPPMPSIRRQMATRKSMPSALTDILSSWLMAKRWPDKHLFVYEGMIVVAER